MTSIQEILDDAITDADAGRSVYVTHLQDLLDQSGSTTRTVARLFLDAAGSYRDFDILLPDAADLNQHEMIMVRDYLNARIYNIISTFGGRSLLLYRDSDSPELSKLLSKVGIDFEIDKSKSVRLHYGKCINVSERMADAIDNLPPGSSRFEIDQADMAGLNVEDPIADQVLITETLSDKLRRIPEKTLGKSILGMDIGGSDIKMVLSVDGKLVAFKEYDWFPANFTVCRQLIDPVCLMARWARVRAAAEILPEYCELISSLDSVASAHTPHDEVQRAVDAAEAVFGDSLIPLDAIGLCFPDVVVKNKIVGGEVYKTRGIRNNPAIDYEEDFRVLTDLNLRLQTYCRADDSVKNINDGPMAAFTAAVEMAFSGDTNVDLGVFAHTLGTELGTGWLDAAGVLPELPLEVYNYVIDLGCRPEQAFDSDDPRSLNNFNTGIAGTLQKYASQSGVFRLAVKYFSENRSDLYQELFEKGFLLRTSADVIKIADNPRDMRKPFLEHLMALPERENDEICCRIFREIGEFMAVTWKESRRILAPDVESRILFGRLVKNPVCFQLMQEGAARIAPELELVVADDESAWTPLMTQLRDSQVYTVAQFAQAVGAVHFAVN